MEDFKDRLDHILRSKNLTATKFAELMKIQPSNVSHLLSGRNKPSIDFLIKLKEVFPEYSFDWIIMGRKPITINDPTPSIIDAQDTKYEDAEEKHIIEFDDFEEKIEENKPVIAENKEVEKILLIYSDKTYDVLLPH
jgi:transcriptional regulator with XRE-family HTH domain